MDIETARNYCLQKKGATEGFPFDEYALVLKVMDKEVDSLVVLMI